jgi:PAS domain S-box-containing protein
MNEPLQILLAFSHPGWAETVGPVLREAGIHFRFAATGAGGDVDSLLGWPWDAVLTDPDAPPLGLDGLLARMALHSAAPPVLVLMADAGLDAAVRAMRRGAADVVRLDDLARLPRALSSALARARSARLGRDEERLRQFSRFSIEKAVEAVFWLDSLGRFFYANEAAGALLGYARRDLGAMNIFDVCPAMARTRWPGLWAELCATGSAVLETPILARDGRLIPVEMTLNHLELEGREYVSVFARDMTERERAKAALAAQESRYRSLFEDSPLSLWEEDLSEVKAFFDELRARGVRDFGAHFRAHPEDVLHCVRLVRIIDVNKATVDLLEAGSKQELLAGLDRVFTEDSLRVAHQEFTALAQGEHCYRGELDHRTMTGRIIRVAVHFNVAPEYRQTLGRVLVSLLDITAIRRIAAELEETRDALERRVLERTTALAEVNAHLRREIAERQAVESRLRTNESRLRLLVDSLPVLVHAHDEQGRYVFWNHESERVLGYGLREVMADPAFRSRMYPDQEQIARVERARREGDMRDQELDVLASSGEPRTIRWTVMSDRSPIPGWAVWEAGIDITDVRKAERRVHALTHELLRAQENERRRIALELHDNVAQNLSSLKICCETLFDDEAGVSARLRERAAALAEMLQQCIGSVRDMSYALCPPGLEQLGLVQALEQFCREIEHDAGVPVELTVAGMEGVRLGRDAEINLYRLVQEALRNAVRHARADRVTVKLVASSPNLILRVEDDGQGFDVDARRAELHENRRMGLQSMEERARLLGGLFSIASKVDKGTRIFVQIPMGEHDHAR